MFCQEWALVKHTFPTLKIIPLRCKCWTCDECRPGRVQRLIYEAKLGKPDLFVTLTSIYTPGGDPAAAARELVWAWRTIRQEYMEKNGKGSLPFLAVFEETKNGWPHLHIVARCRWLDQADLADRMEELTGARVCWVERLTSDRKVANYVTKYIGKNPYRFRGTKRYWRSLDYFTPTPEDEVPTNDDPPLWEVFRGSITRAVMSFTDLGWLVEWRGTEAILTSGKPP